MTDGSFQLPTLEKAFIREIPLGRLPTVMDMANSALETQPRGPPAAIWIAVSSAADLMALG
jgi:hypothetical protein